MPKTLRNIFIAILLLLPELAGAQTETAIKVQPEKHSFGTGVNTKDLMIGTKMDAQTMPMDDKKYSDERMDEMKRDLDREMGEREWRDENTAWQKACEIDSKDAYKKYMARFPSGLHRWEAEKRIVDINVRDILKDPHSELPQMERTKEDDDSPTAVVIVENRTQYVLTVLFSGFKDSKSIDIAPGRKGAVSIPKGDYKVAASVPPTSIRPFAGRMEFGGGQYETGFCVVRAPR